MAVKRGLYIAVSLTALITLLPLMLVVALLIRLDSPGPALFTQVRWGKDRRRINVYKFRSMRTDLGDATGVAQTVRDDPRITRIGAVIRKANIDELPQLLNVLKGDMSLVGPRCHAVGMADPLQAICLTTSAGQLAPDADETLQGRLADNRGFRRS